MTATMYSVIATLRMNNIDVPALAAAVARSLRRQRRPATAGPVTLAAMVDEHHTAP